MRKILAIAALVVFCAGFVVLLVWRDRNQRGTIVHAHFTGDGSALVLVDGGYTSSRNGSGLRYRIVVVDSATGQERVRKLLPADCVPTSGAQLWCYEKGGGSSALSLRRLDTLEAVLTQAQLVQRNPPLQQGLRDREPPKVDLEDGALLVEANDGLVYRVDPALGARVDTEPKHARVVFGEHVSGVGPSAKVGARALVWQRAGEGTRSTLVDRNLTRVTADDFAPPGMRRHRTPPPSPPLQADSYLDPGFLREADREQVLYLENPVGVLLAHHDTLGPGRKLVLTRLDADGRAVWSQPNVDAEVMSARVVGALVVVALSRRGASEVVGLDLATGAVRYRAEL